MSEHAVVVGAGVGGLSAAIGLRNAGWTVTVCERWPEIVGIGAGIGVWPDTQAALDRLGVGEAFRSAAIEFGPSSLFTASGRRLCAVPGRRIEKRGGAPIRILPRTALIDLLATEAKAGCEIHTGVDAAERPELLDAADLVVGADGLRSSVRSLLVADAARPEPTGFVAWRGSIDRELAADEYGETWGEGALAGLTRLTPGRTNFYVAVDDDTDDWTSVVARFDGWRSPIPDVLAEADPDTVLRHPIEDLRPHLSSYVTDRVALIGDAAHAMTPNLGRGACEAVIDADVLAASLRPGTPVADGLARYDAIRRRPTQRMVVRSRRALSISTRRRTGIRDAALRLASPLVG